MPRERKTDRSIPPMRQQNLRGGVPAVAEELLGYVIECAKTGVPVNFKAWDHDHKDRVPGLSSKRLMIAGYQLTGIEDIQPADSAEAVMQWIYDNIGVAREGVA